MIPLRKYSFRDCLSGFFLLASVVCMLLALNLSPYSVNSDAAAQKVQKVLEARMEMLDSYVERALESDVNQWMDLEDLPSDMVVYRYRNDTLQSWANRFTVNNDDISSKVMFQQFTSQRTTLSSPLADVSEEPRFMNLGPNWYLVYQKQANDCKVIAGLEIMGDLMADRGGNGVNPKLKLGFQFSIKDLATTGGSSVCLEGIPMFKVLLDFSK